MERMDLTPDSLPELGAIQMLIEELMPMASQPHPAPARAPCNAANGASTSAVLGPIPVAEFLKAVNWANRADYHAPFQRKPVDGRKGGPKRVVGALPIREFLGAVNWPNAPMMPALDVHTNETPDHARLVIDAFMNEIEWE